MELGATGVAVGNRHRLMGLTPAVMHLRRAQIRKKAYGRAGRRRGELSRARAAALGWPPELLPRQVAILEVLLDAGPLTRRQIAEEVGLPWAGARGTPLASSVYMPSLVKSGLVASLGRVARDPDTGRTVHVFTIHPLALGVSP